MSIKLTTLHACRPKLTVYKAEKEVLKTNTTSLVNVVYIPQDAPKEVKKIMDVRIPGIKMAPNTYEFVPIMVGGTKDWMFVKKLYGLDEKTKLTKQLEIAKALEEKGYNPSDYGLDPVEIDLHLKSLLALNKYSQIEKLFNKFEDAREGLEFSPEYNELYEKCRKKIPWYKRIFKPLRKHVPNPYSAKLKLEKYRQLTAASDHFWYLRLKNINI